MRCTTSRTPCRVGIACAHDKSALNALPCAADKACRGCGVVAGPEFDSGEVFFSLGGENFFDFGFHLSLAVKNRIAVRVKDDVAHGGSVGRGVFDAQGFIGTCLGPGLFRVFLCIGFTGCSGRCTGRGIGFGGGCSRSAVGSGSGRGGSSFFAFVGIRCRTGRSRCGGFCRGGGICHLLQSAGLSVADVSQCSVFCLGDGRGGRSLGLLDSDHRVRFLLVDVCHSIGCFFLAGCRRICLLGGRGSELLHILAHLGDVFPDFHTFFCGTDARDDFRKSLCHKLITPVGVS